MSVRIERIKVNRDGPLREDFILEPSDFNLIYGGNETGKTYLVEAIVKMLFGEGRNSAFRGVLRPWEGVGGSVRMSGLPRCEESVSFTKSTSEGERFGSYFESAGKALPTDFSKLLVVRAGETSLSSEPDGVGVDLLRDCLSGEGLLDEIEERISATVQGTACVDGEWTGPERGENRTRRQHGSSRDSLEDLFKRIEGHSSAGINALQEDKAALEAERASLERAKRHHAAKLHAQLRGLEEQIGRLPDEEQLAELGGKATRFSDKSVERQGKEGELASLEPVVANHGWASEAVGLYGHLIGRREPMMKGNPVFLILTAVSFVTTLVFGFFGQPWGLGVGAILTTVFAWFHLARGSEEPDFAPGEIQELENLRTEYEHRFGERLTDLAALQARAEALKAAGIKADILREELQRPEFAIDVLLQAVHAAFQHFAGEEVPLEEWEGKAADWRRERKDLETSKTEIERQLLLLGVSEENFLTEDPGIEWNAEKAQDLEEKVEGIEGQLREEEDERSQLRADVAAAADQSITEEWETLLAGLEGKREEAIGDYKAITAEIIGKKCVHEALGEAREDENTHIAENLQDPQLNLDLLTLTGRYESLVRTQQGTMLLRSRNDDEFPLGMLSTGAREQVMNALRLTFASKALGEESAFLLLDDAFQHSDWKRREDMVAYALGLVDRGWQIFYFTMDDHLRDEFQKQAENSLGEDYVYKALSQGSQ